MPRSALLIPFAWCEARGGIVEPSAVKKSDRHVYACPGCRQEVIARQGARKRPHFAHVSTAPCAQGLESSLHRAAKQIIESERKLWIPDAMTSISADTSMHTVIASPARLLAVTRVEVETNAGSIRPDLIVWLGSRPLAIEIEVTHPVSDETTATYERNRLSALAINLSKIAREISFASLRERLLSPSQDCRWVHSELSRTVAAKLRKEAVTRPLTWRTSHKRRPNIPHVDCCPRPPRTANLGRSTFANAKLDCPRCPYYLPPPNPNRIYSVRCAGHLAERFPTPGQKNWKIPTAPSVAQDADQFTLRLRR